MPKLSGVKQRKVGLGTRVERPSVDAYLHAAMKVAALECREARTLAYERVLIAGLRALGHDDLVEEAMAFRDIITTKEDLEQLEVHLLQKFGLTEETRMAS